MTFKFLNKEKYGAELKAQVDTLSATNASLSKEKDTLLAQIEEYKKTQGGTDVAAQLATLTKEHGEFKAQLESATASVNALTTERDTLKARVDTYNNDFSTLTKERDDLKLQIEEVNKKLAALEQQKIELKEAEVNKAASQKLAAKGLADDVIPSEPLHKTNKSKWIVPNQTN